MRCNYLKATLKTAVLALSVLLLGAGASFAQQQINLTAAPSNAMLPDGSSIPMWGYSCGTAVSGSTAICVPLNPAAAALGNWSPIIITIPAGATGGLAINLTNGLPSPVPTSIVIVGQVGGGLGDAAQRTVTAAPDHSGAQQVTWPIADPTTTGTPPAQGPRVQSFSTEVAPGATVLLPAWATLRPGTYLLESGTHPSIQGPMGLYGILVVTTAPTGTTPGTAYTGVSYDSDFALLLSEIDPVQNTAVHTAVSTPGFSEAATIPVNSGTKNNIHQCVDPVTGTVPACYPPAVSYAPTYYLVNGVAFSKANPSASRFTPLSAITGSVTNALVRMVNAGLRMHVPSIVGATTGTAPVGGAAPAGFGLIAEDGNPLPGVTRVQSEVFMAAGKTYDVLINASAAGAAALAVYDRELSLSANKSVRDAGMLAYLGVNGGALPTGAAATSVIANGETYHCSAGNAVVVSDPGKGVLANDTGANGATLGTVSLPGGPTSLTFNADGTFAISAQPSPCGGSFTYLVNGNTAYTATAQIVQCDSHVQGTGCSLATGPTANSITFTSNNAARYASAPPGVLAGVTNPSGLALTASGGSAAVTLNADGSFAATGPGGACSVVAPTGSTCTSFPYTATNSQGASSSATATVIFLPASGLSVTVKDPNSGATIRDYRWIIEEDRTFYVNPNNTTVTGGAAADCSTTPGCAVPPTFGVNFHTSYMPVIAAGCTGPNSCESGQTVLGAAAVCDVGNGGCRTGSSKTPVNPSQVSLDPTKRYYISVLPGDAADPFEGADVGHGMGGAPIPVACTPVPPATTCTATRAPLTVLTQPTPLTPAKLSVFVFEDDFPLNGEHDASGGIDNLMTNEPGLGGFEIILADDAGGTGDSTGQPTYDMFNMPLSNALSGTIDPTTGLDACPISADARVGVDGTASPTGITGMIVTCPTYESDGATLSPLTGQAVIANLYPGRYGVIANPGADRIARGEEWLQTNTLDGQKAHDSFLRVGEPGYFQEYGPAGYHVAIGFANPPIINDRLAGVCGKTDPNITGNCYAANTVSGFVSTERMSRPPDERLYGSGTNDNFAFTQCYVSFGDPDGEDFAFTKCAADGSFSISGLPDGDWRITVFDQWNDMLVDGLSTPIRLDHSSPSAGNIGEIAMNQWQANIITSTFFDQNGDGVRQDSEPGLTLVPTNIRFRDGSYSNLNNTDLSGNAGFNEIFPLFSWYVIETDTTRYKNTGTHVVYDAGGPADGTCTAATEPCGSSAIAANMANTAEVVSLPTALRVPGAVYCATADCTGKSIAAGPNSSDPPSSCTFPTTGQITCSTQLSTGRIDPPWVVSEGWQGFSGQNSFIEFGKTPYATSENGGIHGHVIYASTRPFDDPQLLLQLTWEPMVPHVTLNLYQQGTAPDGTQSLTLVDTTQTSSWDDWAQGFYPGTSKPFMNCPGQLGAPTTGSSGDLFFFSLYNQSNYLDLYDAQHGGAAATALPNNSQFKCYDGMHNWNQVQPAPYDGMYAFPSIAGRDPQTGRAIGGTGSVTGTNCTICRANPTDGTPMLPAGKYVVEVVVPTGYELVKEEDKNILIGDNYIAPVTQQFAGLGNIYIIPDQAEVASQYNANNSQNPTNNLGVVPRHEGDTGSVETFWPCVGASRTVPDYISLFPQSAEVSPFAGSTRNLCDRKVVTLEDQMSVLAKFYIFSATHVAAHYTGVVTDDFTSEFDPFSPQFGEKFSPANLPISIKDFAGNEISRTYTDQWGSYDGLNYSTWEVNPPNPTGYAPQMMVTCMNDPGNGPTSDPLFNEQYSQFCYEIPFMPGQTQYMDTPVVPTTAFAGAGYNNVDCAYPDATPAIKEVDGDAIGPWLSASGALTLTITALGDQSVPNYAYSGPSATVTPFNQKRVIRHYGFGPAPAGGCSNGNPNAACPSVTVGGVPLHGVTWTDAQITGTVQANAVPSCTIQQQTIYGGSAAQCGELVITAVNGKQSVDTVTVTIGGKAPTHVLASGSIQSAIDAAAPGDLIIVDPTCTPTAGGAAVPCNASALHGTTPTELASQAAHNELLLMWKPVRLQGVGAASSIINANTHPAGKLDVWRAEVNCLFGLALNGQPFNTTSNPFDPTSTFTCPGTGWNYFAPTTNNPQVDRLPLEAVLGWDVSLNGNLAELLQEPSLMGALEGAGITVLSKGVNFPSNPYDAGLAAGFPTGTTLLTASDCLSGGTNPFPSSFQCNPSRIDGLSITDSSQGGGGVFVHGWGHNVEIANNRIYNNAGTLSGGVNVGQGEFAGAVIKGAANPAPYENPTSNFCATGNVITNAQLPYCFNTNVNLHNNNISLNSSTGDELFSATPAGAGGVSFCTGADYYKFNYNWICGNLSTGEGGGLGHIGFSYNGDIEHNTVLFNQSTNPTIPTNGGGMIIMGTPDVDVVCNALGIDADCVPVPLNSVGPSDGIGPNLVINANLIMGNAAESGSGGGVAFQDLNGSELLAFPTTPSNWYSVQFTNNIVANNVAGWDGAGISLLDAFAVNIINNTIISNDSTASSGPLFNTLGAPLASTPPPSSLQCPGGTLAGCGTASHPQPAGLVAIQNSAILNANLPATITCPPGHGPGGTGTGGLTNGACRRFSYPILYDDVFWQNRSFYIGVGSLGTGTLNQQNVVALYNAFNPQTTAGRAATQPTTDATTANGTGGGVLITGGTGACVTPSTSNYWDIGVRGDTSPTNTSGSGATTRLSPEASILSTGGYAGGGTGFQVNSSANPAVASQYCNGSRIPPEFKSLGYQVPPGIADATVPNPIFSLTPAATVDEGNNWINISWGPLALVNESNGSLNGTTLGNYALTAGSPAINYITPTNSSTTYNAAPATDFFGNARKTNNAVDVGAVEFVSGNNTPVPGLTSINPATGVRGTTVPVTLTGTNLTGATSVTVSGNGVTVSGLTVVNDTTVTATFAIAASATLSARNVSVTTPAGTSNTVTFTIRGATVTFSGPSPSLVTGTTTAHSGTITVSNVGSGATAGPLTLTAAPQVVKTAGPAAATFAITGGTCTSGTVVNPGSSCTVIVQYTPSGTTASTAHLSLANTGAGTNPLNGTNFNAN